MCWGLYLAIPRDVVSLPSPTEAETDEGFFAWPEPNPWVPAAFGEQFSGWILGHGRHCSCGCIETTIDQRAALSEPVRRYLADIAIMHTPLGFAIHWTSGSFATEELPLELANWITSTDLKRHDCGAFPTDTMIWVHGPA